MRFKLDENLPRELARLFVEAGHDAATVPDQGMIGASDSRLASVCQSEDRALVTMDLDFADMRVYPPHRYPGLVVFRLSRQGREYVMEVGARLLSMLSGESLQGQLWIVEDSRVRVREAAS